MIRRPPRSTLFPYTDALPISAGPAAPSHLEEHQGAVVGGGSAAGEGGDVGVDGFEDLARRVLAQGGDVAHDALLPEALAAVARGVRQSIGEQAEQVVALPPGTCLIAPDRGLDAERRARRPQPDRLSRLD